MVFDPNVKELAKAHDAVDRLLNVQHAIERREANKDKMHDRIVRGTIFVLIAFIVGLAIWKL